MSEHYRPPPKITPGRHFPSKVSSSADVDVSSTDPAAGKHPDALLTERELAARWKSSVKKVQSDRLKGVGPRYLKIGRLVRYRLTDIEAYEAAQARQSTSELISAK